MFAVSPLRDTAIYAENWQSCDFVDQCIQWWYVGVTLQQGGKRAE